MPAVTHIIKSDLTPAPMLIETTRTIGQTIADESGFGYELISYDDKTGQASRGFTTRRKNK